jgi:hypothetical protein
MAPWGEERSIVRGWSFLLVARVGRGREHCARKGYLVASKSGERKRALCENGVFCWLQEWEEEKWALGGRGYLWPEEHIQPLLKKLLPKRLEELWHPFNSN